VVLIVTYGIGGGGIVGIAVEQLSPPLQSTIATASTGGTIAAGTYRYLITAINANGESHGIADNGGTSGGTFYERSIVTTGSTSTVTVTWTAVVGATGYKLYKTAAGGASGTELLYKTVGAVTTDIDTTPGTPSGAFPTSNTASTPNVYTAPTKFFPLQSENMKTTQATVYRRGLRQLVDIFGAVAGNTFVEGDLEIEALDDVVPYFLMCGRMTLVKSGTAPNLVYTGTPTATGSSGRTLSITVVRNNVVFGYVGCVTGSWSFTVTDGQLMFKASVVGSDEAVQTLPTPTYSTTSVPYGAGTWSFEIPTATQIFDVDGFDFSVEDNAEPQFRLKNTGRGAQYIKFGQRDAKLSFERDFPDRTEYDNFKSVTATSTTITAARTFPFSSTINGFSFVMPSNVRDTYEVSLGSQGDLVRASQELMVMFSQGSGTSYNVVVKTQEVLYP
jgi:hypothetical protein